MFVATEDIGQQRKTKDEDAEHGEDLNHSEDEEEKTDEEENKDEEYQKEKEQRKDKDHSMSNSEKLDKLIQMVRDLDKRVVVIQNVLGVKVTSPTPTFNTPNFDTRFHRLLQHLRLLSLISFPKKVIVERVLMRDVCEIPVFQPLMKIKKRLVQQDSQVNEDVEPPLQKKFKADTDNVPLRRSERVQIPSIHTQPPFIGARKKHPILRLSEPTDLFLNKTALVVGVKFLEEIDELYDEFLDDKKGFQFGTGFDKYNIEKNINFLYSTIAVAEKYWLGVVVNVEKRSITAFNCAAMKFTDASFVPYVNAYAMALPFMIRNFFKDVLKIEDSGVYALKLIECHGIRIMDLTKLSEEKNAIIREKLAVDIFSELQ
uniref:Ubiquitin-like protease family profile domain-containing protein n=1 Tax=Brassica oleracea TaxID=3712 RepID=A0A3P6EFD7_BRAOL|nr:unnamed protein product [Brassica oleracea]